MAARTPALAGAALLVLTSAVLPGGWQDAGHDVIDVPRAGLLQQAQPPYFAIEATAGGVPLRPLAGDHERASAIAVDRDPPLYLAAGWDADELLRHVDSELTGARVRIFDGEGHLVRRLGDRLVLTPLGSRPSAVRAYVQQAFQERSLAVRAELVRQRDAIEHEAPDASAFSEATDKPPAEPPPRPGGPACVAVLEDALRLVRLPDSRGAETSAYLSDAAKRYSTIHALEASPCYDTDIDCGPVSCHPVGFLHNLWHRLTGT